MGKKVKAIIGKIQYKFGDMPLYHKLLIIFGAGLGIEFLVALLILSFIGNAYNELLYEQADNAMSYFSRNLEAALKDIEELSANTISDSVIQKEMDEILGTSNSDYSYSVARTKLENQLMRNFYVQNDLMTMSLFQERNLIVSVGKSVSSDIYNHLGMLEEDYLFGNKDWICVTEDYSLLYIRRIRKIESLSLKELGHLVIRIDFGKMISNAISARCQDEEKYMLCIQRDGDVLVIDVCNTGSEIDEHILEHLESGEVTANGNGIGLRNIQERLNLTYGADYGLSFSSADHRTIVRVRIPF